MLVPFCYSRNTRWTSSCMNVRDLNDRKVGFSHRIFSLSTCIFLFFPFYLSLSVKSYISGGSGHNGGASLGSFGGTSLLPWTRSALRNTGITPPVSRAKSYKKLLANL